MERAFEFARRAHEGQKRFSGEDYIQHPARVAQILKQMHLDSKTVAAGLLHDVPDDTKITLEEIEKEFGKEVAFLVEGVSKLGKLRYPKQDLEVKPVEERKENPIDLKAENLRKMFFAMAEDIRVILIKLADRLHNMETLDFLPPEKRIRIALETLEIFAPLADRLGMGEIKAKLEDLAFPYLYPKEYEWLMQNVKEKYEIRKRYLKKLRPVLEDLLKKEKIKPLEISSRAKTYWSLYQKLLRYEMDFDRIHDLVALRVVVKDIKTCYEVLGIIHKFWKPLPQKIKDYIAFPKPNNYRALHTTCFCLDGKITEIQIKTEEMHKEAKTGICAHWAMKEGIDLKTQGKKFSWIKQLKDWQEEASKSAEFLEGLKIDFFKNRIFVFTPKGDVIDLPEGASPVDFAYAIHTEVGNQCAAVKINGKLSPLSQPLKNGEVVEIVLDKNKKPSPDWLKFVKTTLARSRIKRWLKLNQPFEEKPSKETQAADKKIEKIFPEKPRPKPEDTKGVLLAGQKGIKVHLAKCCFPRPGDPIRAWINKTRGASIHKINCDNLIQAQKKWPQRIVEASWAGKKKILSTRGSFEIEAKDRLGLLKDIASTISEMGINILSYSSKLQPPGKPVIIRMEIETARPEQLNQLLQQLKQIKNVLQVKKV